MLLLFLCGPGAVVPRVHADIVCSDSSYVSVTFAKTYTANYMTGQPYDFVTVSPSGGGETFSATGITIRVYLKNCQGEPLVGVPAQEIILFNSGLCVCPGGNTADSSTDLNGCTQFSGTIRAGGCVTSLTCFADGVSIGIIPVKINSQDRVTSSPCVVDADDLGGMVFRLGKPERYSICFDFNETGTTIDASDLAAFASVFGVRCQ